jgi:hypothetical protein
MIDPTSIMSASARQALSSLPSRSEATLKHSGMNTSMSSDGQASDDEDEDDKRLSMSPTEIRIIRRLSERVNVLPVIAKSDSLTDEYLAQIKDAVRHDLLEARIDLDIFGLRGDREPSGADPEPQSPASPTSPAKKTAISFANANANGGGHSPSAENGAPSPTREERTDEDDRQSRPVIKLRRPRHANSLRRSRSRTRQLSEDDAAEDPDEELDVESIANVRFSAGAIARTDLAELVPFALMVPERKYRRRQSMGTSVAAAALPQPLSRSTSSQSAGGESASGDATPTGVAVVTTSENGISRHADDGGDQPVTPSESGHSTFARSRPSSYLIGPPENMRGVFLRKFRWGTVDVLDPNHCDFAAMRTTVLTTHLKVRKTNLVLCRSCF